MGKVLYSFKSGRGKLDHFKLNSVKKYLKGEIG